MYAVTEMNTAEERDNRRNTQQIKEVLYNYSMTNFSALWE